MVMKIKVQKTTEEDVTISDREVDIIVVKRLRNIIYPGEYITERDGIDYLCMDDPNWRHGSVGTEVVRPATELDQAVCAVLSAIQNPPKV